MHVEYCEALAHSFGVRFVLKITYNVLHFVYILNHAYIYASNSYA